MPAWRGPLASWLPRLFRALRTLNFTVTQPVRFEGPEESALIEVANLRSLGQSEMSYLEAMRNIAGKLDEFETRARERLLREAQCLLEDRVWSAYGQLRHGRIMSEARAMRFLGDLRLGCLTEITQSVSLKEVQDMWLRVQDGYLQAAEGRALDAEERDLLRANRLREWLARSEDGSIGKDKLA
jgi:protein arginine kinase